LHRWSNSPDADLVYADVLNTLHNTHPCETLALILAFWEIKDR
jgi:ornithine carbamoyltransferase